MNKVNNQYIDLNSIREETYGDVSILKQIMELFIEIIDEYVVVLNEELPNKNWKLLHDATHKIKPNINMFGISVLETTILELESNFRKEENLENIAEHVYKVIMVLKEVRDEVQYELKLVPNE